MSIFLLLGGTFLITFLLGILLEKIRVPWIFSALIVGLGLAFYNPFYTLTSSDTFKFLAWLGMYFMLFLIGFELDLEKIKKLGKFIIKASFFIIFFEAIFGSLLIHFVFGYDWLISILVALSFATVGEAVLIPILDEFKLTKTKLGQSILGIGTFDDMIEVLIIILAMILIGNIARDSNFSHLLSGLLFLAILCILSFGVIKFKKGEFFLAKIRWLEAIFLLTLAIFFLFIGVGKIAEAGALGALLAGVFVKNFLPKERTSAIESEIKALTYGFFGPIFFLWVGVDTDVNYLLASPLLVLLVIAVAYSAKILASYLVGKKELGTKPSILMGIALGVRFSTSIVIIKFFFEKALIGVELYSVLIASTILFKFIIPFLRSFLIQKWKIGFENAE